MNDKQKRFVTEYLVDCNGTQAAIRAGYSKRSARQIGEKLLTKDDIRMRVEEELKKIEDENIAKADEVLKYLTAVMRGQTKSVVLATTSDGGQDLLEKAPDEKERIKAAELLGKRYSLFKEAVSVDAVVPVVITDDLDNNLELAGEIAEKIGTKKKK